MVAMPVLTANFTQFGMLAIFCALLDIIRVMPTSASVGIDAVTSRDRVAAPLFISCSRSISPIRTVMRVPAKRLTVARSCDRI